MDKKNIIIIIFLILLLIILIISFVLIFLKKKETFENNNPNANVFYTNQIPYIVIMENSGMCFSSACSFDCNYICHDQTNQFIISGPSQLPQDFETSIRAPIGNFNGCPDNNFVNLDSTCTIHLTNSPEKWKFVYIPSSNRYYIVCQNGDKGITTDPYQCERQAGCFWDIGCAVEDYKDVGATQWALSFQNFYQMIVLIRNKNINQFLVHRADCCVAPCMNSDSTLSSLWAITVYPDTPNLQNIVCIQAYQGDFADGYLTNHSSSACNNTSHSPIMGTDPVTFQISTDLTSTFIQCQQMPFGKSYMTVTNCNIAPCWSANVNQEWEFIIQ
jgi:hypothetical protein